MKTKISVTYDRLTLAEFVQLLASSVALVEQKSPSFGSDDMIEGLFQRIKKQLPYLEASIKQKRGSDLTETIKDLTKLRNADFQALVDSIKPFKASRSTEKCEAYQILHRLFKQYKELNRATLGESPTLIKSLLSKLAQEDVEAQVSLLGLSEYVANLKESQSSLNTAALKRSQETSDKHLSGNVDLRQNLKEDYKLLYSCLQNKIAYNPQAEERELLNLLNEVRQGYADILKRRQRKMEKASKVGKASPEGEVLE